MQSRDFATRALSPAGGTHRQRLVAGAAAITLMLIAAAALADPAPRGSGTEHGMQGTRGPGGREQSREPVERHGERFQDGPDGFRPPPGPPSFGPPVGPRPNEIEQLDLTDTQRDAFATLRDDEHRQTIRLGAELEIATLDLDAQLGADKPDAHAIDGLVGKIGALRTEMLRAHVATMLGLESKLTPEQRARLRQLRQRRGPDFGPGPMGGRPPRR